MIIITLMFLIFIIADFDNGKVDGHLRLADDDEFNKGRLEISINGYWGTVCSVNFNKAAADIACKELGFNASLKITTK